MFASLKELHGQLEMLPTQAEQHREEFKRLETAYESLLPELFGIYWLTTQFTQSALYELINTRLVSDRRTVISSNLTMTQVRQRYTPQIASRLEGEYRVLPFYGEDIRLQKKRDL